MPVETPAAQRHIEVDGGQLLPDCDDQVESVVVIDRLAMPDTFAIVFRDPGRDVLGRAGLKIGTAVKISTARGEETAETIMDGEITSIEADYDTLGARAIVRGYDLSHRLNAGRRSKTFMNMKASDIAGQIASSAGLQADVDDSGRAEDHVFQPNLSDLDFLYGLARDVGFVFRVEGHTLSFKKRTESTSAPAEGEIGAATAEQLVWTENLLEFRARISAVAQVKDVQVRGWDVKEKAAVIGSATAGTTSADLPLKPADLAKAMGDHTLVITDRSVGSQEAAQALAEAKADQVGSSAFEATAVAIGSSKLKAGVAVSISGVDPALVGKWVISQVRHEFGFGAYRSHIECSGHQDRSLHGLVANALPTGAASGGQRAPGVAIAIVTANQDPDDLGRVKVKFPWLADDTEVHWARVAAPGAGPDSGLTWLPEVNDEVLVAFEMGDFARPFVIGGLWNGKDKPMLGDDLIDPHAGTVKRRGIVSRLGHKLVFFDDKDKSGVALLSADGKLKVSLNATKNQVHIVAENEVLVEAKKIVIKADTDAAIEAKNISLKASGEVKIKGSKIALNPPGA